MEEYATVCGYSTGLGNSDCSPHPQTPAAVTYYAHTSTYYVKFKKTQKTTPPHTYNSSLLLHLTTSLPLFSFSILLFGFSVF